MLNYVMIDKTNSERYIYDTKRAGYGGIHGYHIFYCYARIGGINLNSYTKRIPLYLDYISHVTIFISRKSRILS